MAQGDHLAGAAAGISGLHKRFWGRLGHEGIWRSAQATSPTSWLKNTSKSKRVNWSLMIVDFQSPAFKSLGFQLRGCLISSDADQEIVSGSGTIREEELDAGGNFLKARDSSVQPHDVLFKLSCFGGEQIVKISAVKLIVWRAVQPLMLIGQRKLTDDLARIMESKNISAGRTDSFAIASPRPR